MSGHTVTALVLADVATRLWRARRHALRASAEPGADDATGALNRSVLRELAAALATLEAAGVTVQDHDGAPFDPGQALVAVSFEPTADLLHEQVIETLRPSVYLGDRHIQRGEVVVGVPQPVEETPDVP